MSSMWNKLVVFGLAAALSTAVLANEGGRGGIGKAEGMQSSENVPAVVSNEAQASAEKTEYATSNPDTKKDKKSNRKRKGNHHRSKKSADAAKTDGATTADASASASNGTTSDAGTAGMTPASKY